MPTTNFFCDDPLAIFSYLMAYPFFDKAARNSAKINLLPFSFAAF
jgi:hypothetical protein